MILKPEAYFVYSCTPIKTAAWEQPRSTIGPESASCGLFSVVAFSFASSTRCSFQHIAMDTTNKNDHPNAVFLQSAKLGFDYLFSNDIVAAKRTFEGNDEPFHLLGLGVCAFLEAALGMEVCRSIVITLNVLIVISLG
jgi:hypothetical protein